ncbi:MAG: metallophosphoesterase [Acidobacteria bacterium]|nr:metallophosphoesterase [Acidobacteriota bacterium]
MNQAGRIAMFLLIVLGTWTAMHLYVGVRLSQVPWLRAWVSTRGIVCVFAFLWACYPTARLLERTRLGTAARPLEFIGAEWMGVLFLIVVSLLAVDVVTGFGWLLPRATTSLRTGGLLIAGLLSVIAIVQGMREPVMSSHEIQVEGLPTEHDGLVLVYLSDLHLGSLLGERWLTTIVDRVNAQDPRIIVLGGDVFDSSSRHSEALVPALKRLRAPLGVWAVTGNHEYYAGVERCVELLQNAEVKVLRDRWEEVIPGVIIAGVDDMTARRQFHIQGRSRALDGRPPGITVFLSHTPWGTEEVAAAGVDLMLSGHTHNGQIWPFTYFVQTQYPYVSGRYTIGGMHLLVCRGTGTWGPRMRLWRRSEILRITLRPSPAQ